MSCLWVFVRESSFHGFAGSSIHRIAVAFIATCTFEIGVLIWLRLPSRPLPWNRVNGRRVTRHKAALYLLSYGCLRNFYMALGNVLLSNKQTPTADPSSPNRTPPVCGNKGAGWEAIAFLGAPGMTLPKAIDQKVHLALA